MNDTYQGLLIVIAIFLISACTAVKPFPRYSVPLGETLEIGGFHFDTPTEYHWNLVNRNEKSAAMVKQGNQQDESYAIQVWSLELPIFGNDQAFEDFVVQGMMSDTPSSRFNEHQFEHELQRKDYGTCLVFNSIHEDTSATKQSTNNLSMLLEVVGQTCINPNNPNEGAHMVYSNRYYRGGKDLLLSKKAEQVLGTLRFK